MRLLLFQEVYFQPPKEWKYSIPFPVSQSGILLYKLLSFYSFFFYFSELLLKLELNLSVCLSYVETRTESKLQQSSTVSWFLKSSKLLSWHRKNRTVTSSQHLDQGSTLFEQLRSIVASVHFTSVYKLPPCVGHTNPLRKFRFLSVQSLCLFLHFFQYFKFISFIFKGNCLYGLCLCSDGENKHPKDQKVILTVQNICVQYWHMQ